MACISVYYFSLLVLSQDKFIFQPKVCNRYHDMTQKPVRLDNFSVVTVATNIYSTLFLFVSNDESVSIMKNSYLNKNSGPL